MAFLRLDVGALPFDVLKFAMVEMLVLCAGGLEIYLYSFVVEHIVLRQAFSDMCFAAIGGCRVSWAVF